jgi:hypothetical protein
MASKIKQQLKLILAQALTRTMRMAHWPIAKVPARVFSSADLNARSCDTPFADHRPMEMALKHCKRNLGVAKCFTIPVRPHAITRSGLELQIDHIQVCIFCVWQ